MYIKKEVIELTGVVIISSFCGWLIWEVVFWLANHISIEWVN
jgi:hypothetical protein